MQRPPEPGDGAAAAGQPSVQPAKQPRLMAVDALRGWAIVLVVAAHVVWGLRMAEMRVPQAFLNMYDFIFTFAAQALFFVSGCLAVGSLRRGRLALTLGKARALIYPYVVWSLIVWTL
ncbi:acyltransferase family protein, partial [Fundidesulfovibrio agrisoli]|uniref:acyltransferase family protein n=1 Tax=Fundidesulfovibrio agrisoli TaxID=2922717 RepID=UPI001FAE4F1B